jgi:hypothetical protein
MLFGLWQDIYFYDIFYKYGSRLFIKPFISAIYENTITEKKHSFSYLSDTTKPVFMRLSRLVGQV